MLELFMNAFSNPANMAVGGLLVSSPILIHLINRMRYKRLRWAAMEFLLKSQKRNRRRLIIEQLILLLLRILLVLLAGLLLARLLGVTAFGQLGASTTVHMILLDDRLSMNDQWKDKNESRTAFQAAKETIEKQIAKPALLNHSPQFIVLRRLSEPNTDLFNARINDQTIKQLKTVLEGVGECTQLHLDMSKGVAAAREMFGKQAADGRNLYIVSDFRLKHWSEPDANDLKEELKKVQKDIGVKVKFVDIADPKRSDSGQAPLHHDNLAIVDFRPESRIAAQNVYVPFRVSVANYGAAEKNTVMVTIRVNGEEDFAAAQVLRSVPPGRPTEATFMLAFKNTGFNQVTAHLEAEPFGLNADNTRFAVVEVRKQVSILAIDGENPSGDKAGGDLYHLRTLFKAAKGYDVVGGTVSSLEASDLYNRFSSIYLCNVRELSDKQLTNLENYVREGGGLAFFMGERITSAEFYNKKLYDDGKGLFPAPITDQPTKALTEEERTDKLFQNLREPQYQLYLQAPDHPVLREAAKIRKDAWQYLNIDRYHPVARQKWKRDPEKVRELVTLPNNKPLADYIGTAEDLVRELPIDDPRFASFKPALELHSKAIRIVLRGKSLYPLATALDALLGEGDKANTEGPGMKEFWQQPAPEVGTLMKKVERLRDAVKLGDPFMIAREYGKGRVVAVMTTAGRKWNDWAGGGPASFTFPVVILEMQKYLSSIGEEANLTVGSERVFEGDAARYEPFMDYSYQGNPAEAIVVNPNELLGKSDRLTDVTQGKKPPNNPNAPKPEEKEEKVRFEFAKAQKPGIYFFQLTNRPGVVGAGSQVETRAFAFNVDTINESDLRRVPTSELVRFGDADSVVNPTDPTVAADHKSDLSESGWLYLAFLAFLIMEQALAVHLSFHLKGNEAAAPTTSVTPRTAAA